MLTADDLVALLVGSTLSDREQHLVETARTFREAMLDADRRLDEVTAALGAIEGDTPLAKARRLRAEYDHARNVLWDISVVLDAHLGWPVGDWLVRSIERLVIEHADHRQDARALRESLRVATIDLTRTTAEREALLSIMDTPRKVAALAAQVAALSAKLAERGRTIAEMGARAAERNRDIDALHFVWCNPGCRNGLDRGGRDPSCKHPPLTREMLERAIVRVSRMASAVLDREWHAAMPTVDAQVVTRLKAATDRAVEAAQSKVRDTAEIEHLKRLVEHYRRRLEGSDAVP